MERILIEQTFSNRDTGFVARKRGAHIETVHNADVAMEFGSAAAANSFLKQNYLLGRRDFRVVAN